MKALLAKAASAAKSTFSAAKNVVGQVVAKVTGTATAAVTTAKAVVANVAGKAVAATTAVQAVAKTAVAKAIGSAQQVAAKSASNAKNAAKATANTLKAAATKAKDMGAKVVGSPVIQCPLQAAKEVATQKNYWLKLVDGELLGKLMEPLIEKTGKTIIKPSTVKGAATLIKAAGRSVKPILAKVSPDLAKAVGKATNKGTINAIGKSLRAFSKTAGGKLAGNAIGGGVTAPIWEFATRAIEGKSLFTKPALFNYGSELIKGAISGAIAGAIVGSVVPGPGTAVGIISGLIIGVATTFAVDWVAKPLEDSLRKKMEIIDD